MTEITIDLDTEVVEYLGRVGDLAKVSAGAVATVLLAIKVDELTTKGAIAGDETLEVEVSGPGGEEETRFYMCPVCEKEFDGEDDPGHIFEDTASGAKVLFCSTCGGIVDKGRETLEKVTRIFEAENKAEPNDG